MFYEIKKMFIHQKGLWLIILYFVLSLTALLFFDTPANTEIEHNRQAYEYYIHQVEGKCTAEAEKYLSEEAESIANANSALQKIYSEYYDGNLSDDEFLEQSSEAKNILRYENGFNLVYEQYSDIRENTDNRYFLYTNGWDGLLSHDSLNLLFVLLILLIITPVFCYEYENGMDALILTEQKSVAQYVLSKIFLVFFTVTALCLLDSSLRYTFFQLKYGLPHGSYPLQSLSYFAASTSKETLTGAFLKISAGKLFGSLSFAVLILFVSVYVKKYALTLFSCTAVISLPYYGLSASSAKYFLPGPLSWMISTGYLRGSEYQYDSITNEKIITFQEIPSAVRWLLFAVTLCFMFAMLTEIIKKHTNVWCSKIRHGKNCFWFFSLMVCMIIAGFSGCSASGSEPNQSIFNMVQNDSYENENYRFFSQRNDSGEIELMFENKTTGEIQSLVRNPMQSLIELSESIYGNGDFVYYMQTDYDESQFFPAMDRFSVVEVDTKDFSEKIVFERNLNTQRDSFLGIGEVKNEDVKTFSMVETFFLDNQTFYFVNNDQVFKINRLTGKNDIIIESPVLKNLAFDGQRIYYINTESKVVQYDIYTDTETELPDIVTESFLLAKDKLIFLNRLEQNQIYLINLEDGTLKKITDQSALYFSLDGNTITYTAKDDLNEHQIRLE